MEKKFYELSHKERIDALILEGYPKEALDLISKPSDVSELEKTIENVIGVGTLPIGIIKDFVMNKKKYLVPMMIEEPSVVAAANKASKLLLPDGFIAESLGNEMIGECLIKVEDSKKAEKLAIKNMEKIDKKGKELSSSLEKYGGGWRGLEFRPFKSERGDYLVCYFYVNVADAMGANRVNSVAEELGPFIADLTDGMPIMGILSNLAVRRIVGAKAIWKKEKIGKEGVDGVLEAFNFASNDIFRLCTNNKGIMNGIDAVALATGNDWRAVEAGLHTYSMMNKKPLVSYREENGDLVGVFEGPLAVAITGGATKTFNHSKASLALLNVSSAVELAQVMACVGLANNFAALFALSTEGIQKGHMRLHSRNIAIQAGAKSPEEIDFVASELVREGKYDTEKARKALDDFRKL